MSDRQDHLTLLELKALRQSRSGSALKPLNQDPRVRSLSQRKLVDPQWRDVVSEARFNMKQRQKSTSNIDGAQQECSTAKKCDQNNNESSSYIRSAQTLPASLSRDSVEKKESASAGIEKWLRVPEGWDLQSATVCVAHMRREECLLMPCEPPISVNIKPHMRAVLCDWMIQVQHHLRLLPSTLYLAIQYVDRFVHAAHMDLAQYQCLGVAAIFLSSKLEERYTAEVSELVYLTDNTFTVSDVVLMEKVLLGVLDFRLATPEASWFLRLGVDACAELTETTRDGVLLRSLYFLDLLMLDESWPRIAPSFIAATAIALSLAVEKVKYPNNLERLLGYKAKELGNFMSHMASLVIKSENSPLRGCFQKYCSVSQYEALARHDWVKGTVIKAYADAYHATT